MPSLAELVSASVAGRPTDVERLVFGMDSPSGIAELVERTCLDILGSGVASATFYEVSVGCVAGVQLVDGRDVVLKAYQPRWTAPFLTGVRDVQAHLSASGFPCARPITGPAPMGNGLVTVEERFEDPGPTRAHPSLLSVSATGLADLVARCRPLDGTRLHPHPLDTGGDELYPEPHSPIFDFAATAAGAAWIDELATVAKAQRDRCAGPPTIAHTDWSLRNVRLAADRVTAVYDWDSLSLVAETTAVGQATITWSAEESAEVAPTSEEVAEYVEHYERARGRPFSDTERRGIGAAALYSLAYTARCEHAIDPEQRVHRRARSRMAADGDRLLDLARVSPRS